MNCFSQSAAVEVVEPRSAGPRVTVPEGKRLAADAASTSVWTRIAALLALVRRELIGDQSRFRAPSLPRLGMSLRQAVVAAPLIRVVVAILVPCLAPRRHLAGKCGVASR
jgi:hypothetical protein